MLSAKSGAYSGHGSGPFPLWTFTPFSGGGRQGSYSARNRIMSGTDYAE